MWSRRSVQSKYSAAIALVFLYCGCGRSESPPRTLSESERNAVEELTPIAQELFSAAVQHDTARLRRTVSDSTVLASAIWLATHERGLIVDASQGLDPVDSPLLVTPDSCYLVFFPKGHRRDRDLLAMWFKRNGASWRIDYLGFQEPRHRSR